MAGGPDCARTPENGSFPHAWHNGVMTTSHLRNPDPFAPKEEWKASVSAPPPESEWVAKILSDGFAPENFAAEEIKHMHRAAISCLSSTADASLRSCVPALINAGAYNLDPEKSLHHACFEGLPGVVKSLAGSLQWDSPSLKPMMTTGAISLLDDDFRRGTIFVDVAMAAAGEYASRASDIEQCVLSVLDMGAQAGHSDLVFSVTKLNDSNGDRQQPVCAFADAKFHRAIVKFLEHGFDPHSKMDGAPSLMEYADENSPQTAHVIRSFEARQEALGALREIEKAGRKP